MNIEPIETNADYRAALKEIEELMAGALNTPDGEKLDVLRLVQVYAEMGHPPYCGKI